MKNCKNLLSVEFKRNYKQLLNMFMLVLVFVIIINVILILVENEKIKLNTTIGLAVEDQSREVNLLLGSIKNPELKEIITFKETDLEKGKKLLNEDKIVALISVKKGTFEKLDSGESASLYLYVKNKEDLRVQFLSNYLNNMVEILNGSQNSALIYYHLLKDDGSSYKFRRSELDRLSFKYVKSFLFRGQIFENDKIVKKFLGLSAFNYYYNFLLVLLMIFSSMIYHTTLENDLKKGRINRLLNAGYKLKNILFSKVVISIIYVGFLIIPLKIIFYKLFQDISFSILVFFILKYLFFSLIVQIVVILGYFSIRSDLIRDLLFISILLILSFAGGFIVPLDSLSDKIIWIKEINIIYIIFKSFIKKPITLMNILAIFLYFISFIYGFKKAVFSRG